jgi:acyl-CoA synthetase (AMP-forming)/AMP-acid ligase II
MFFVDSHLLGVGRAALRRLTESGVTALPVVLAISDDPSSGDSSHGTDYEDLVKDATSQFKIWWPVNELDPIALNYTSGTTSRPKGVVYSHRGAYLNTVATVLTYNITAMPTYLWTVPMFHGNGWNLTWGVAAMQGGTNVCLRHFTARVILDSIARHGVTHMGGAPTVLNMVVTAPAADRKPMPGPVRVMTGGAPPVPRALLEMEALGFVMHHVYGLTETCGAATVRTWMPAWDALPAEGRARRKARQGFHHVAVRDVDVKNPATMESVPHDGRTLAGRGDVPRQHRDERSGYYKDLDATKESMAGGWLRSGDLPVRHPDGYIQVKDRAKDIIISGGENISSIEVESVILSHPAVVEAAVVARPDDHWGETPCAFVKLKRVGSATEAEIVNFCQDRLPRYMAPKTVVFEDLPKTSSGKTQKFLLREKARTMGSLARTANTKL